MIQQGAAIDASAVELRGIDVETLGVGEMTASLKGADGLVIAVGFVPGNPFKMTAAANAVDNVGTVKLIDAAKVSPDPPNPNRKPKPKPKPQPKPLALALAVVLTPTRTLPRTPTRAKAAGVKKVVLVSSILTDAGAWGQLDSAGYKVTNAFGQVLEAKHS